MSVTLDGDGVKLTGDARLEDAELLCAALAGRPERRVDVSGLERAHTAVIQTLLALAPQIVGEPADPWLRDHIITHLQPLPLAARNVP